MVEGLIALRSSHPPKETADRLAASVAAHGMTLIARVDHAAAAAKVDLDLRPTEVLIFGNPAAGTKLMRETQAVGLALPLKILVWQDEAAATWISYEDMAALAKRYSLSSGVQPTIEKMASLLKTVATEVAE